MEIIVTDLNEVPEYFTGIVHEYYLDKLNVFAIIYFENGKLHREDGPAIIYNSGLKKWYFQGENISPQELFDKLTSEQKERVIWNLDEWK